jgi:hypothetical protein
MKLIKGKKVDLLQIRRVEELKETYLVNYFLEIGWVLLEIYTQHYPSGGMGRGESSFPHYIVGWPQDSPPPYPNVAKYAYKFRDNPERLVDVEGLES